MERYFIIIYSILLMIPFVIIIYHIIPMAACRMGDRNSHKGNGTAAKKSLLDYMDKLPLPKKGKEYLIQKIDESGLGDQNTWVYWMGVTFILPFVLFTLLTIQKYTIGIRIMLSILCFVLPNILLGSKIQQRKQAFIINAYKLYYFLHSQISSGIKVTDAIKGIYEIADHPLIQKTFIQFVAQYELTLNMEESLKILRRSFPGYDCDMLCASILQCVNTGMAGKTLLKMEQMMFSKYFFYLQKDTEKFKVKLIVSGVFAIIPLVMIFLLPMIFDSYSAFNALMQTS